MAHFAKTDLTSLALEVEGELLWVIPEQLGAQSETFKAMFFTATGYREAGTVSSASSSLPSLPGSPPSGTQKSVPIDASLECFLPFLRFLTEPCYSFPEDGDLLSLLNKRNCPGVLELAERYQVHGIKNVVQNFLLKEADAHGTSGTEMMEILSLGVQFYLPKVVERATTKVSSLSRSKITLSTILGYRAQIGRAALSSLLRSTLLHYTKKGRVFGSVEACQALLYADGWPDSLLAPLIQTASAISFDKILHHTQGMDSKFQNPILSRRVDLCMNILKNEAAAIKRDLS